MRRKVNDARCLWYGCFSGYVVGAEGCPLNRFCVEVGDGGKVHTPLCEHMKPGVIDGQVMWIECAKEA